MVRKVKDTPGCTGCPLFEDGNKNFVPDVLRERADVMVLGQNPGAEEEAKGVPFIGQTGKTMDRDFFPQAGLQRSSVSIGNALRCRWQNSNELPEIQSVLARAAVEHCSRAHLKIGPGTTLLVATGGYALLALTGHGWATHDKITEWRGWMLPLRTELGGPATCARDIYTPGLHSGDLPVLATIHVAAVGYDPSLRLPAKSDWQKVRRYLRGDWPAKPPKIITEPDPGMWVSGCSIDTEWIPESGRILRFSLVTPDRRVYVVEWTPENLRKVWRTTELLQQSRVYEVFRGSGEERQEHRTKLSPREAKIQRDVVSRVHSGETTELQVQESLRGFSGATREVEGAAGWMLRDMQEIPRGATKDSKDSAFRSQSSEWDSERLVMRKLQSGAWDVPGRPEAVGAGGCLPLVVVFQNGVADIPKLAQLLPDGFLIGVEDTMLLHSVLH
jgi:uracil-DNA glycosylase family 4